MDSRRADDDVTRLEAGAKRSREAKESPIGRSIGRYMVLMELGKGGAGTVYRAYDPKLRREVALKLLRGGGPEAVARVLREAQAMARLSHPNVVPVYDVDQTYGEGGLYLAMEFIPGVNMRQWMKQRPPWRDVLARFVEAGNGLAAAHAVGIVHRDFKNYQTT